AHAARGHGFTIPVTQVWRFDYLAPVERTGEGDERWLRLACRWNHSRHKPSSTVPICQIIQAIFLGNPDKRNEPRSSARADGISSCFAPVSCHGVQPGDINTNQFLNSASGARS